MKIVTIGIVLGVAISAIAFRLTREPGNKQTPAPVAVVAPPAPVSLAEARRGFKTKCIRQIKSDDRVEAPPKGLFEVVKYNSSVGSLAAYLTPNPNDGKKHPAIVWITGGDCNSIGDVWSPARADNDQTASAFR